MSKIEELIQQYCPDGVEWKTFNNLGEYIRGITYNKSAEVQDDNKEAWKVLRANNITLSNNTLNFDDVKKVSKDIKVKENQLLKENDILICAGSGSKEHIGKVAYIFESIEYTFGGFMGVIRCNNEILNSRFFFHILTSQLFKSHLETNLNSTTINNLNAQIMNCFSIPLPPLPVQEEIVRILDNFTTLEAELEAELEARQQQYQYYRDNLLSFEGRTDVEWKKIEEICKTKTPPCKLKTNEYQEEGVYPIIDQGQKQIAGYTDNEDALVEDREYILYGDHTCIVKYHNGCFAQGADGLKILVSPYNNSKYVYYAFCAYNLISTEYKRHWTQAKEIEIPVPPLPVQQKIVDILDRFDTLTNDLTAGLPAEIAARKKQYEYYRDKLLTFRECRM